MKLKQLFFAILAIFFSQTACLSQTDEENILKVVDEFFDAMEKKDSIAFNNLFLENAYAYSVRQQGDSTLVRNSVLKASASNNILRERLRKEEITIHVNKNVAAVWAPYDFWIDDEHSHCGYEIFTFLKNNQIWKIASLTYSVEKGSCNE